MNLKRLCGCLVVSALVCSAALAQDADKKTESAALASPLGELDLQDGDSIVFLGDSITHQRLYTQYVEDFFYTRFPHLRLKIHNAGVGGARAIDALERFEKDVAAYQPKYVTILLGMNDGSYQAYNEDIFQTYQRDMTTLLDQIEDLGATAILMSPTMYDTRALQLKKNARRTLDQMLLYNSVLAYYGKWLQELANLRGLGYVDMYGPLNQLTMQERKKDPRFTLIPDAIHPGPDGQLVMAEAIINDLGLKGPVSVVALNRGSQGQWSGSAEGGELTDVQGDDQHLAFTFHSNALPWVLPADAAKGVELTNQGEEFSLESLQVVGLVPGKKYRLSIDGGDVGTYSAAQLAQGIELQSNEKTPQYQQALKVAELNKKRNLGPIARLRGEWLKFQRYARAKRTTTDPQAIAKLDESIEGMDERVSEANAEAKAIEDQIFEMNQPKPHKYELTPVED